MSNPSVKLDDQTTYPLARDVGWSGNQWTLKNNPSCVGFGSKGIDVCDNSKYYCAGGTTFGPGTEQMKGVFSAFKNGGKHPNCPS